MTGGDISLDRRGAWGLGGKLQTAIPGPGVGGLPGCGMHRVGPGESDLMVASPQDSGLWPPELHGATSVKGAAESDLATWL